MKLPGLQSLTSIPMNDQRHVDASISYRGALNSHPLKTFRLVDVFSSRKMDCCYVSFSMLKLSNYQSIQHISLDMVDADDLEVLAESPDLICFACSSMPLDQYTVYSDLNAYNAPVFRKVVSVVIRHAFDYRRPSYLLPKMFTNLPNFVQRMCGHSRRNGNLEDEVVDF